MSAEGSKRHIHGFGRPTDRFASNAPGANLPAPPGASERYMAQAVRCDCGWKGRVSDLLEGDCPKQRKHTLRFGE
jgi:hypothetical protein